MARPPDTLPLPEDDDPPWQAGARREPVARYRVDRELARGGLGRVLVAHDRTLDRPVALKELIQDTPANRARFHREIRFTARLQHPAIVPLYEAVEDASGAERYTMKLVSGETLAEAIAGAGDLDGRLALLRHVEAVADALAYAHAQGVIHRDVKPQNVLVGAFGETVLIDWGVAKALDDPDGEGDADEAEASALTRAGTVVGTPAYMAPEQARGEPADRRADVYALGATLYHLLAGRPPWPDDAATTLTALRSGASPPPLPAEEVPADLRSIVARAMAPDREERYPSALELSRDLLAFRTGQLVAARTYTAADLALRWVRRHRALVTVAAVAALVLGIIGAVSARRVVAERDLARAAQAVAEARTHALLLEHARRALDTDPTEAAAWLAAYPTDGAQQDRRFELAQALGALGVARVAVHPDADGCDTLAWSSDGRALLPTGHEAAPLDAATGAASAPPSRVDVALPLPDGGAVLLDGLRRITRRHRDGATESLPGLPSRAAVSAGDGRSALVGDVEGGLWDLTGPRRIHAFAAPPVALAVAGGRWYAADPGGTVWSGAVGAGPADRLHDHPAPVERLAAPSQGAVVLGDARGGVYRAGDRRPLIQLRAAVTTLAVSPDGARVAAADGTGALVVRAPTGTLTPPWPPTRVIGARWSPGGDLLAVNLADGSMRLWWPERGQVARRRAAVATNHDPTFAPDGASVATCYVDGSVRVWPVPATAGEELRGHEGRAFHLLALPDGRLATDSDDRTVRLWTPGQPTGEVLRGHEDRVYGLAVSPDGRALASAGLDARAFVWELATGVGRPLLGHVGRVRRAGFLGDRVFTAGSDGTVRLWDRDGTPRAQTRAHEGSAWWAEAVGDAIWSVGGDRRLVRWQPDTGALEVVAEGLGPAGGPTLRPYGLPDGRVLTCDGHGGLAIFGPDGRRDLAVPEEPGCTSFAQGGGWVAIPSERAVYRLDPATGAIREVARQSAEIHAVAVSPDGRLLATASLDGTARVWRVADGAAAVVWRGDGPVLGVAFSPDSRRLGAVGVDAVVWWGEVDERTLAPADPAALTAWTGALTTLRMAL